MRLACSTYSADRGYAWSSIPEGLTPERLNDLYRFISIARGDFPDPLTMEVGLVSDGRVAAAFTIQNIEHWDANCRASDYGAFAFFPVSRAGEIDFIELLNRDFFWTPDRHVPAMLDYDGPAAQELPPEVPELLRANGACTLANPRAAGRVLAECGARATRWIFRMVEDRSLQIECNKWQMPKENES